MSAIDLVVRFCGGGMLAALAVLLAACVANPQEKVTGSATEIIQPAAAPVENVSNFTEILECVGRQVGALGSRTLYVGNDEIANETGIREGLPESGRSMLQSAFATISEHANGKVRWYAWSTKQVGGVLDRASTIKSQMLQGRGLNAEMPDFFIVGAITQYEKNAKRAARDADIKILSSSLGDSDSASVSVLGTSLTLNSLRSVGLEVYRGIKSDNLILVKESDSSTGLMLGTTKVGGVGFNVSFTQKEGVSAALMNLMQMAAIEIVGKFYKDDFSYRTCLEPATRKNVIASLGWKKSFDAGRDDAPLQVQRPRVKLQPANEGVADGVPLKLVATSPESGFLYCFYNMASGRMVRIFPNRYVQENFLKGGVPASIPGDGRLKLIPEKGQAESVACIFSRVDAGAIVAAESSLMPNREQSIERLLAKFAEHLGESVYAVASFQFGGGGR